MNRATPRLPIFPSQGVSSSEETSYADIPSIEYTESHVRLLSRRYRGLNYMLLYYQLSKAQ